MTGSVAGGGVRSWYDWTLNAVSTAENKPPWTAPDTVSIARTTISVHTYVDQERINLSIPAFDHLIAVLLDNLSGLLPSIGSLGVGEE